MNKETRTKIPEGTTRVINAATGEVKLDKMKELEEDLALLNLEVMLKDKYIKDLESKLHEIGRKLKLTESTEG